MGSLRALRLHRLADGFFGSLQRISGDWQALFGVNLRCPHLSWYTMKGRRETGLSRQHPAPSPPGIPEYHYLEDYFSRIHAAPARSKADAALLVISPIESVWARSLQRRF